MRRDTSYTVSLSKSHRDRVLKVKLKKHKLAGQHK